MALRIVLANACHGADAPGPAEASRSGETKLAYGLKLNANSRSQRGHVHKLPLAALTEIEAARAFLSITHRKPI